MNTIATATGSVAGVTVVSMEEAPKAMWQYHGQWIEKLSEAYINYVMLCLLRSRKVQAVLLACSYGGQGGDIQLHLYVADTGQEIHPQPVILCHRGDGLFWIFSSDADRVEDVLRILSRVLTGEGLHF